MARRGVVSSVGAALTLALLRRSREWRASGGVGSRRPLVHTVPTSAVACDNACIFEACEDSSGVVPVGFASRLNENITGRNLSMGNPVAHEVVQSGGRPEDHSGSRSRSADDVARCVEGLTALA